MPIAFRHRDDPSPFKLPVQGLAVHREVDPWVMARMHGRDASEIQARFAAGHRGIRNAGFTLIADLSFDRAGRPVVRDIRTGGGSAASRLLGLPAITEAVAMCWKCAREPEPARSSCASGVCSCDHQRAEQSCTVETA